MADKVIRLSVYARLRGHTYLTTWAKAKQGDIPGAFKDGRNWFVRVDEQVTEDAPTVTFLLSEVVDISDRLTDVLAKLKSMESA